MNKIRFSDYSLISGVLFTLISVEFLFTNSFAFNSSVSMCFGFIISLFAGIVISLGLRGILPLVAIGLESLYIIIISLVRLGRLIVYIVNYSNYISISYIIVSLLTCLSLISLAVALVFLFLYILAYDSVALKTLRINKKLAIIPIAISGAATIFALITDIVVLFANMIDNYNYRYACTPIMLFFFFVIGATMMWLRSHKEPVLILPEPIQPTPEQMETGIINPNETMSSEFTNTNGETEFSSNSYPQKEE